MTQAVLVIDDDPTLSKNISRYLGRSGCEVRTVSTGEEGLSLCGSFQPDVVLLDYQLNGMDGLAVLQRLMESHERAKVIFMTGHGSVDVAVQAIKAGAWDYIAKPLSLAELKLLIDKAIGHERLEGVLSYYQRREEERGSLNALVGESPPMQALKEKIRRLLGSEAELQAGTPPAALITGETGTGKELIARALHFDGPRRNGPFVDVNCATIPPHLIESELFGYERGAFTDARSRKTGLVEAADGGTLFLDEIGEIDPAMQAKLLKLLEGSTIRRLGSVRDRQVDVRIVAATNRDLESRVHEGHFRDDLYFRLRIVSIQMPALRERGEDVLALAHSFLHLHAGRYGRRRARFDAAAEDVLRTYAWPGNVRELRNVVEQALLLSPDGNIGPEHLSLSPSLARLIERSGNGEGTEGLAVLPPGGLRLDVLERDLVRQALDREEGNVTRAARLLGLTRDTLRYRMEKHGMTAR